MLSIANISSGVSASYYEKDDYYSKEGVEKDGKAQSYWFGSLVKELGLKGEVNHEDFESLLKGKILDFKSKNRAVIVELGKDVGDGKKEHAAGVDLTFSAPKSISILAEIGGDTRLLQAHNRAITYTLDFLEKEYARTRVREGKSSSENTKVNYAVTGKLAIATFKHNTSRRQDPQLHTHCVVINATKTPDGKYRSAEFYKFFQNKFLIGAIYRSEMAREVRELGYTVDITHRDGRFEIKEIPEIARKHFSTRRQEIEKALAGYDKQDAKAAANATLVTREAKKNVDRETLREDWSKRISSLGINLENIIQNSKDKSRTLTFSTREQKALAKEAVGYAISSLSEKESVFEKSKVIRTAIAFKDNINKDTSLKCILKEIDNRINKSGELIIRDGKLACSETIITEKENIKLLNNGKEDNKTICKRFNNAVLNNTLLNEGQKSAVSLIVSSNDRVIGVQGSAGTGKTFMLNEARNLMEKEGFTFVGMAPSASATLTLKEETKLQEAETLQKFLKKYEGLAKNRETEAGLSKMQKEFARKVIVVDESSMISTKQMNSLLKITEKLNCKLVLVGDTKQLASVEAGKPFYDLQKAGMKTAEMNEIIRQKDLILKEAVHHAIKGDIVKAFDRIGNNIIEKREGDKIADMAVNEYFKLSNEDRANTLMLAPSNETRNEINSLARIILKDKGELNLAAGKIMQEVLEPKHLTYSEKGQGFSYNSGEVIIFNRDYKKHDIKKGESFEVKSIKENGILLQGNGKEVVFNLKEKAPELEVFRKSEKEIAVGDSIRYLRNDREKGIVNSHTATIKAIDMQKGEIVLDEKNGKFKTLKLDDKALKHIDYAYASTAFASQGKTTERVIAVLESSKPLTNQQTFYVEISRAKQKATLIVDDKQAVQKTLECNNGLKVSALEIHDKVQEKALIQNR